MQVPTFPDAPHGDSAEKQQHAGNHKHAHGKRSTTGSTREAVQNQTAAERRHNLRDCDGAVEQPNSVYFIQNQYLLFVSYSMMGCAWAAMLAMPFTILTNALSGGNIYRDTCPQVRAAKRSAALRGPMVCDDEGPLPILYSWRSDSINY